MLMFFFLSFMVCMVYYFHNFFLMLLGVEFFLVFIYFFSMGFCFGLSISFFFLVILVCYFVLEAIMGLNLVLLNYRYLGVSFFSMW